MEDVYKYIDEHLPEAVEELARLCRQPSISAQGIGLEETAALLSQMLQEAGLVPQVLPVPKGKYPVVFGELEGETPYTVLLYNHYDVQPPEPLEEWASPPFEMRSEEGKLYARGASDNKGNIVARLAAIRAYLAVKGRLPVGVKFCIEGEEEIGSPHLSPFLEAHKGLLKADACIWEGSQVNWQGQLEIVLGAKGILYVEMEVRGADRDVHSSLATVVPNPAWRLVWALSTLKDKDEQVLIEGFYDDVRPPTPGDLVALDALPHEDEALIGSLGLSGLVGGVRGKEYWRRHLFEPTCNICGIVSGYTGPGAKTVLPGVARAKVDFRLVPDQRPKDIFEKLRRHLDKHGFEDITMDTPMEGEHPARTPMDSDFVKLVAEAAREVYGKPAVLLPTMAATGPMAYVRDILALPVADAGVGYPDSRIHAPNENIRLEDFARGMKHIAAVFGRLEGKVNKGG